MPLKTPSFSRREREVMDVMHALGPATAAEIHAQLGDPPTYSSVRATLRRLEEKGHVKHKDKGHRNVYVPIVSNVKARKTAIKQLVDTFFGGSTEDTIEGLLAATTPKKLKKARMEEIARLVDQARKKAK